MYRNGAENFVVSVICLFVKRSLRMLWRMYYLEWWYGVQRPSD